MAKLLIVEKNADIALAILVFARSLGHDAEFASSLAQARLHAASDEHFAAAVVGGHLPDGPGIDLLPLFARLGVPTALFSSDALLRCPAQRLGAMFALKTQPEAVFEWIERLGRRETTRRAA